MRTVITAASLLAMSVPAWSQTPSQATKDAEFSVAAVDFVTTNCSGLVVDYDKLTVILKDAAMTEIVARESQQYKHLTTSFWPDAVKDIGMRNACYELQVHFVKDAPRNMRRLIHPR